MQFCKVSWVKLNTRDCRADGDIFSVTTGSYKLERSSGGHPV